MDGLLHSLIHNRLARPLPESAHPDQPPDGLGDCGYVFRFLQKSICSGSIRGSCGVGGREHDDGRASSVREATRTAHKLKPVYAGQAVIEDEHVVTIAALEYLKRSRPILAGFHTPTLPFEQLFHVKQYQFVIFNVEDRERPHVVVRPERRCKDDLCAAVQTGVEKSDNFRFPESHARSKRRVLCVYCTQRATTTASRFRWVLSSEEKASREEFIRCLLASISLLAKNTALAPLRWFFCREQIFMPSLNHRTEPLMCNSEQTCSLRDAAPGIFKGELNEPCLIA